MERSQGQGKHLLITKGMSAKPTSWGWLCGTSARVQPFHGQIPPEDALPRSKFWPGEQLIVSVSSQIMLGWSSNGGSRTLWKECRGDLGLRELQRFIPSDDFDNLLEKVASRLILWLTGHFKVNNSLGKWSKINFTKLSYVDLSLLSSGLCSCCSSFFLIRIVICLYHYVKIKASIQRKLSMSKMQLYNFRLFSQIYNYSKRVQC